MIHQTAAMLYEFVLSFYGTLALQDYLNLFDAHTTQQGFCYCITHTTSSFGDNIKHIAHSVCGGGFVVDSEICESKIQPEVV